METKSRDRVTRWTQKLLDLSLRNRLLNMRDSRQLLPLEPIALGELEDRLAAGESVAVESAEAKARTTGSLRTSLTEAETARRLKELSRLARTQLEETGMNALYLAVGQLKWRPKGADAKDCRAPLLLVPVGLSRKGGANAGFALTRFDGETELNATLLELLRAEFGISVAGVDPLPEDANGVAVDCVLQAFREAVRGLDGWAVEDGAALGYFSFGKFVMWKDLSARAEQLSAHPFVSHLMRGGGSFDDGVEVFPPEEVGSHIDYLRLFCPLSADSSQLTAVLYSALGKSFVLHGPPGTGKSQTITNLIAHNLALGRKVLFVAEKKAALDVVHRRLSKIGLKPFCLELHSAAAGKAEVMAQIREVLDFVDRGVPNEWERTVVEIDKYREALDGPVAALHRRRPNGLSAYDCFASRIAGGPAPVAVKGRCSDRTEEEVSRLGELVRRLGADWCSTSAEAVRSLAVLKRFDWTPAAERDAAARIDSLLAKSRPIRGLAGLFTGWGWRAFGRAFPAELQAAKAHLGESRDVMRYRATRDELTEAIGPELADTLEAGAFSAADLESAFNRSLAAKTLDEILADEPTLADFAGLRREEHLVAFRRIDAEYAALTQYAVCARLAAKLPGGRLGDCPEGCELGILRRECAKKSRQRPVRRLLAETRGVIGALKPCFLMSPLSVSQYLPAEASFDLVVFDEASQIPVWDAVGVIARAKQCVVVGDPRQMPPTDFFRKGETEASEEDDDETDLESILDECLAAGLPSSHLNWHYRSRHESLIAFSNHNYYDDRLLTFPAAKSPPQLGVRHVFVADGVYGARTARTNPVEAKALVDYVFARLADPDWKRRSVGIVTFSTAQRDLIEDLFEERRAADPRFEDYFAADGEEPFFVKNLENVQGDERDAILFSIGYAKGADGKFLMNFGPLNRAGGERRLNVAVTRAKEQVVVFSSCHSAEIDLSRTSAVGAAHLKAFLEYAERGGAPSAAESAERTRDAFADEVASFLSDRGYAVQRNVGCSGYRIDVGVGDPKAKGSFMAAIECDGDAYAAALTVRDRDALRASVLRSLGWNTLRVWAADWALDRPRAEARLLRELDEIARTPGGLLPEPKVETKVTFPRRRAAVAEETPRTDLDTVSNDRIRAEMDAVERDLGRCERDTLYRETARRFGYKTLSPKARARLESVRR